METTESSYHAIQATYRGSASCLWSSTSAEQDASTWYTPWLQLEADDSYYFNASTEAMHGRAPHGEATDALVETRNDKHKDNVKDIDNDNFFERIFTELQDNTFPMRLKIVLQDGWIIRNHIV